MKVPTESIHLQGHHFPLKSDSFPTLSTSIFSSNKHLFLRQFNVRKLKSRENTGFITCANIRIV